MRDLQLKAGLWFSQSQKLIVCFVANKNLTYFTIEALNIFSLLQNAYFKSIGGKTTEKFVKRILSRVFSNQLARKFNWTGKKGSNKEPLRGLKSIQILAGNNLKLI